MSSNLTQGTRSGKPFLLPSLHQAVSQEPQSSNLEVQPPPTNLPLTQSPNSANSIMASSEGILKQVGKFDGSNWEEFCSRFEKACTLSDKEPKDMLIFHVSDDIFKSVKREVEKSDWPGIKKAFQSLFGKQIDQSAVLRDFHARMQGPSESVQSFLLALRKIEADLDPAVDDKAFLTKFTSGLRADIRRAVKIQVNLNSVDSVLNFVKEIEVESPTPSQSSSAPVASPPSQTPSTTPVVHAANASRDRDRKPKQQRKTSTDVCEFCERTGHRKQDCHTFGAALREEYFKRQQDQKRSSAKAKVRAVAASAFEEPAHDH